MSGKTNTISKEKAVQLCADLLYAGKKRKEIVQELAKTYKLSTRAIDNYIKLGRVIDAQRQQADETVAAKVRAELIEEVAKELGINRKRILAELAKVAFLDIRKLYKEDGTIKKFSDLDDETAGAIAGVEVFEEYVAGDFMGTNRKVKSNSKLAALQELSKLLGYAPQTGIKAEINDPKTGKSFKITLNLA